MLEYILIGGLVLLLILVIVFIAVFFLYQKRNHVEYFKTEKDYYNGGVDAQSGKYVNEGQGFMPKDKQPTFLIHTNNCIYVRVFNLKTGIDYGTLALNNPKIIGSTTGNADLKIPCDSHISAVHCRIYSHNWIVYIDDMNSKNGTYLNNQKIVKGAIVNNGDMIYVGNTFPRLAILINTI